MDLQQAPDDWAPELERAPDNWAPSEQNIPENQTVSEKEFRPATAEDKPKEVPSFLKSVEMIGNGSMEGSLKWTGRLLSFAEGKTFGTNYVQNAVDHWTTKNAEDAAKFTGAGMLQGLGSLPTEIATTAPIGPLLGTTAKLASTVGNVAGKTAQYATSAGLGGATLAGMEGLRADANMANVPFSTEQAGAALKNPATYAAPMAGTLLTNWAQKASRLEEARKLIPGITNRNLDTVPSGIEGLTKPSTGGWIKSLMFDSISNQVGAGHSARLQESVGSDIAKYINTLSGNVVAKYKTDYIDEAGKTFQRTLAGMKKTEGELWGKLNLDTHKPTNLTPFQDDFTSAVSILNKYSDVPEAGSTVKLINDKLNNKNLTLADVKDVKGLVASAEIAARGMSSGNTGRIIGDELKTVKESLISKMQGELSSSAKNPMLAQKTLKDLAAANQFSANHFDLKSESNKIKEALFDDVAARSVTKSMISEAEAINKTKTMGAMSDDTIKAMTAAKLAGALEASGYPTNRTVDIGRFVELTGPNTVVGKLMGSSPTTMGETHKAYMGLTNLLKSVQDSGSHKMSKLLLASGALGGVGAVGGIGATAGILPAVAVGGGALLTYAALAGIANHSPLKKVFSYISKGAEKLSPSVYKQLSDRAYDLLTKSGYFMTDEGVLDYRKKDRGNINLGKLPRVSNPDGSYSTVKTITIEEDGKTILIPTIINGKAVSNEEAIRSYHSSGKHLGKFNSEQEAEKYDAQMHKNQGWTK